MARNSDRAGIGAINAGQDFDESAFCGAVLSAYGADLACSDVERYVSQRANGAIQAAEAAGLKVGAGRHDIIIVGGNCQVPGIKDIEAGKMVATVVQLPVEEGKLAATVAKEFFAGKKPKKMTYLPTRLVTKANLAKCAKPCSY